MRSDRIDEANAPHALTTIIVGVVAVLALTVDKVAPGGIGINQSDISAALSMAVLIVGVSILPFFVRPSLAMQGLLFVSSVAQLVLGAALLACCSVMLASLSTGYIDAPLVKADALIGLSWQGYRELVLAYPVAHEPLRLAYGALGHLILLTCVVLAVRGRQAAVQAFIIALFITASITLIGAFFPAVGPWHAYGLATEPPHHVLQIEAARRGEPVMLFSAPAVISVPSFHTAAALLVLWAHRQSRVGMALFALPTLALLAATPLYGAHYFIDLVAGAIVAAAAVAIATWMSHWWRARLRSFVGRYSFGLSDAMPAA